MSAEILVQMGAKGADAVISLASSELEKAVAKHGIGAAAGFPETNFYLPLSNALLNKEITALGGFAEILREAGSLNANKPASNGFYIPALGGVLNKGIAVLLCEELLAALAVLEKKHPQEGFAGFLSDKLLRSLGIQLVDGRIAGVAVILGPAKDADAAVEMIKNFQVNSIVSIIVGESGGVSLKHQLESKGVQIGLDNYIVPLGQDYLSAIYAVNWAVRAPLIYGGFKAGQWEGIADYVRNRVPAFVVLLCHVDEVL